MKDRRVHAFVVFGTRPEAIKLAPVIRELGRRFRLTVCATGQHRELLDQVTRLFRIPVDHDLGVMQEDQKLDELTGRALARVSQVLDQVNPDVIIVQGDTTTAFVAALAGFYRRTPVAHIEAGLRTQDRFAPFPEEINRRLITQLADYHFAPTCWARDNLLREGVPPERIFVTGNTIVDVFLEAERLARQKPPAIPSLDGCELERRKLILVTAHRRENFGPPLRRICLALRQLAQHRDDIEIVYPVHPNPNVRKPVRDSLCGVRRIHVIDPLEYLQFVWLMSQAYLVLTDSGGIQEEMPSLGRPVLVMRDKTERPEGVQAGVCQLVGTRPERIRSTVLRLLDDERAYRRFARHGNPFGDGKAAPRIATHLARILNQVRRSPARA
jgi:UDP-N-acetylglucosamine 2-epimerase (non-hydrolysing)